MFFISGNFYVLATNIHPPPVDSSGLLLLSLSLPHITWSSVYSTPHRMIWYLTLITWPTSRKCTRARQSRPPTCGRMYVMYVMYVWTTWQGPLSVYLNWKRGSWVALNVVFSGTGQRGVGIRDHHVCAEGVEHFEKDGSTHQGSNGIQIPDSTLTTAINTCSLWVVLNNKSFECNPYHDQPPSWEVIYMTYTLQHFLARHRIIIS